MQSSSKTSKSPSNSLLIFQLLSFHVREDEPGPFLNQNPVYSPTCLLSISEIIKITKSRIKLCYNPNY
ncbi:hypothetical protein HanRHA438_Chr15g0714391 [Helianthus annuus]|nr:hypothetical protein HanIR_Chr15g0763591 [Helianthus annuus]KAJ0845504.1 hypothetical protein HanRHA438_Chr15g0714391 [Helianthus annuus]